MEKCHIGALLNRQAECNDHLYDEKNLSLSDLEFLKHRVKEFDVNVDNDRKICEYYLNKYLKIYSSYFKYCCDPFKRHKKKIDSSLHILDLDTSKKFNTFSDVKLIPRQKICTNCRKQVYQDITNADVCFDPFNCHRLSVKKDLTVLNDFTCESYMKYYNIQLIPNKKLCSRCLQRIQSEIKLKSIETSSSHDINHIDANSFQSTPKSIFNSDSQQLQHLDQLLGCLNLPVLRKEKLNENEFKSKVINVIQEVINVVSSSINNVFNVSIEFKSLNQNKLDSDSLKDIINNLKSKYDNEQKITEKISLLTLLPKYWSHKQVNEHFNCSRYMWRSAQRLQENQSMYFYSQFDLT